MYVVFLNIFIQYLINIHTGVDANNILIVQNPFSRINQSHFGMTTAISREHDENAFACISVSLDGMIAVK